MIPLFNKDVIADDQVYINIRDGNGPYEVAARQWAENLWSKYHPYADTHFLIEIRKDFHARFWEMFLACTLIDKGYTIESSDRGPDIKVDYNGKIIWIEATTPTGGSTNSPDSVPSTRISTDPVVAREVPDSQIILRYRSAIHDKYFDKYFKYVENYVVSNDDCYIIALNGCRINWSRIDYEPPRIVRSVLPFGFPVVTIDTTSKKVVKRGHQYRESLIKRSGSLVATDIFMKPEYRHISAVMFSNVDVANPSPIAGNDFITVLNPLAVVRLPDDFPKLGRLYDAKLSDASVNLSTINWIIDNKG